MDVLLDSGELVTCRTYQMIELPEDGEEILPSKSYLKVMVKGAIESQLPEEYVNQLKKLKHNGNIMKKREDELNLNDFEI